MTRPAGRAARARAAPELLAEVKATGVRAVALATAAADPNAPADAANAPLALLAFADARRTTLLRVRLPRSQAAWARKEGLAAEAVGLPEGALAADALLFGPVLGGAVPLVAAAEDGTVQVLEVPVHSAAPPTLRASRAAHALRFKLWALRERARSAARFWEPALQSVALSPDGRALALPSAGACSSWSWRARAGAPCSRRGPRPCPAARPRASRGSPSPRTAASWSA
ncbi:hypothetical protein QBZ16_002604 [Prototheca wickerhamii]|uniref:Uncharacterized protein n=1 Tax=Prototheca wickerhamii TaxID=3111 RepID=A0AAD9MHQ0_PROWI|nr:hypothetical protein QBZ16_002604 [Prototheca wickerhamii]